MIFELCYIEAITEKTRDVSPPLEVAFLNKIGCGSNIQNESFRTFVLHFAHLALSLDKIGSGSDMKTKVLGLSF